MGSSDRRLRRSSVFDTSGFDDFLTTIITERDFDDLRMPFAAIARDKETGGRVVLTRGDPVRAAAASAAVRHTFPPVRIDGRWLVDGIRVDPVPGVVARELGATHVVGVDVVPTTTMRRLRDRARAVSVTPLPSGADVTIRPVAGSRSQWDFSLARELIALGESTTQDAVPMIEAALAS